VSATRTLPASQSRLDAHGANAGGERTPHAIALAIVRASTAATPTEIADELRAADLSPTERAAVDALAYQALAYKLLTERLPMPTTAGAKGRHPGPQIAEAWRRWLEQTDITADGRAIRLGDFTREDVRASIERRLVMVNGLQSEIAQRRLIEDGFAEHPKAKRVRDLPPSILSRVPGVAA
jgi:hypothetical protein